MEGGGVEGGGLEPLVTRASDALLRAPLYLSASCELLLLLLAPAAASDAPPSSERADLRPTAAEGAAAEGAAARGAIERAWAQLERQLCAALAPERSFVLLDEGRVTVIVARRGRRRLDRRIAVSPSSPSSKS